MLCEQHVTILVSLILLFRQPGEVSVYLQSKTHLSEQDDGEELNIQGRGVYVYLKG